MQATKSNALSLNGLYYVNPYCRRDRRLNKGGYGQVGCFLDFNKRSRVDVNDVPRHQFEVELFPVEDGMSIHWDGLRCTDGASDYENARPPGTLSETASPGDCRDDIQVRRPGHRSRRPHLTNGVHFIEISRSEIDVIAGFDGFVLREIALLE